jgi:hypothetical protein
VGILAVTALSVWLGWFRWSRFRQVVARLRQRERDAKNPPSAERTWVNATFDVLALNARVPVRRPRQLALADGWLTFTVAGHPRPTLQVAADQLWMQIDDKERLIVYGPSIARITISGVAGAEGRLERRIEDDSPLVATLAANGVRVPSGSRPRLPAPPRPARHVAAAPRRRGLAWPWARRPSR